VRILSEDAISVLDQWLDLHQEIASGSDADNCRTTEQRISRGNSDG
jgi:hypothetical protein